MHDTCACQVCAKTTGQKVRGMLRSTACLGGDEEREEEQEDEGDEDLRDGGVPFFVNRSGLPVNDETWERMWRHVARIHPDGDAVSKRIRGAIDLPKVVFFLW